MNEPQTEVPSPVSQTGVLTDEEVTDIIPARFANDAMPEYLFQSVFELCRAIESAVLAKQASTEQSGEEEGLLREALDECRKIATGERQVLDAVDDTDGLRAIEKIASKALAVMK